MNEPDPVFRARAGRSLPAPGLRRGALRHHRSRRAGILITLSLVAFSASQVLGADPGCTLFADHLVGEVRAVMDPGDLAWLLDPANAENNDYLPAWVRIRIDSVDEVFPVAGIRLRGNYSRHAEKKGFKIALDAFDDDAKLCGVTKLNLVGEHNDPCIVREKLAYDALAAMGVQVSQASHVRFFLNDEYRGLYIHVEEVDEAFLRRRFGSAAGNLYKCQGGDLTYRPDGDYEAAGEPGRPAYELQTRRQESSFVDLAELIAVINLTPPESFDAELERVLDVASFVKSMAFDVLAGNWDDYWIGANNYFLYSDPLSGRFHFMPRDLDMTFGLNSIHPIDFTQVDIYRFGRLDSRRPLILRVLARDHYRNLYTHFVEELLAGPLAPSTFAARGEQLRLLIRPAALADTYRTRDFPFIDYDAFDRGYDEALGGHVQHGLRPFMVARAASAAQQINYVGAQPALWAATPSWALLVPGEDVNVRVGAFDEGGVDRVELHVDRGQGFATVTMADDGQHGDGAAGDGIFGAPVAGAAAGASVRYFIEAGDLSGRTTRLPAGGADTPVVLPVLSDGPVVLNELMARNATTLPDEAGEFDDWIELWNRGPAVVNLAPYRLADDPGERDGWALPAIDLEPGAYVIIWADGELEQGERHASFRLNGDGEWLGLYAVGGGDEWVPVDAVGFGPQERDVSLGRVRDGERPWSALAPTPGATNSPVTVEPADPPSAPGGILPTTLALSSFPNPLRTEAVLVCDLPRAGHVTLDVVDVHGRIRHRLVAGIAGPGRLAVYWDGRDGQGEAVPAGVYFLRLNAAGETRARAISVIR